MRCLLIVAGALAPVAVPVPFAAADAAAVELAAADDNEEEEDGAELYSLILLSPECFNSLPFARHIAAILLKRSRVQSGLPLLSRVMLLDR